MVVGKQKKPGTGNYQFQVFRTKSRPRLEVAFVLSARCAQHLHEKIDRENSHDDVGYQHHCQSGTIHWLDI